MNKTFSIYITTSKKNGTIYIGMTNNLLRRIIEHKTGLDNGFSKRYKVHKLVYFEQTKYVNIAIAREKELKGWTRIKKTNLIEKSNPSWSDLFFDIGGTIEMLS